MPPAFRNARVVDARTGRQMQLTYPADERDWPVLLGAWAAETWSRFQQVHTGRGTTVWRGTLKDGGAGYYFKAFSRRGPGDRWKDLLRGPRAARAWRHAWQVEALGFRVIRPVCLMTGARGADGLLVTREESDATGLRSWLRQGAPRAQRASVLAALGREVARWHAAGLFHADLNLDNLLLRFDAGQPVFVWLDLEGVRRPLLGLSRGLRAKNLTDMNYERGGLSRTDRLRVWQAYCVGAALGDVEARPLRDLVIARTRRRWRKRGWLA